MATGTAKASITQYLLTDPNVMGVLGWIGLALTLAGIAAAFYQAKKARTAAEAAESAAKKLEKAVFARERLLELNSAIALIGSAKDYTTQRNFSHALIFLDLALQQCAQARELLKNKEGERMYRAILKIKKLSERLAQAETEAERDALAAPLAIETRDIISEMNALSAKLRYRYDNEGAEP